MSKRKTISKRIRFEVFKRDKFTCQYCGRMSPDVTLEVDHIKPVSKGGTNDIMNLITACRECNSGKSNIELSDNAVIKKQQAQLQEIAERKEQLEMMLEWRNSLNELDEQMIDAIDGEIESWSGTLLSYKGREIAKKWLKEFNLTEILDAIGIAFDYYFDAEDDDSFAKAFYKIPGIIVNKRREKESDSRTAYYVNYTVKTLKNKAFYCDKNKVKQYITENIKDDLMFEQFKKVIKKSRNWTDFRQKSMEEFGGLF